MKYSCDKIRGEYCQCKIMAFKLSDKKIKIIIKKMEGKYVLSKLWS